MARINTYDLDATIKPDDLLIGSSLEGTFNGQPRYATRNYKLSKLAEFFIAYDFNAGLSLTTLEGLVNENIVDISALESSVSTINTSLTSLTGRVSTAETRITQNFNSILSLQGQITSGLLRTPNWDAAYNESITGISVTENEDGSQKTITLTRRNAIDLSDGFTDIFESGTGGITDTNNYVDSVAFNTSDGVLTLGRLGLSDLPVDLDGRYSLLGHTHTTTDITNLASYTGFDSRYVNVTGDTITGPIIFGDNIQLRLGSSSDFRFYHNGTNNIIHSDNGDWVFFDGFVDRVTISRGDGSIDIGGNTVWHEGNLTPSDYLPLTGGTLTGQLTVEDEIDCGSIVFSAISSFANANDFNTFMPQNQSLMLGRNFGGSLNYPTEFGQTIFAKSGGSPDLRSFAIHKVNNSDSFYLGNWDNSSWTWNKVWHDNNDGSGSGLDADLYKGLEALQLSATSDAIEVSSGSMNNTRITGIYNFQAAVTDKPSLLGSHGLHIERGDGSSKMQLVSENSANNNLYYRSYNSTSWGSWVNIWHSGNDGSGSGLDADTVDSLQASQFLRSDVGDAATGNLTFQGQVYIDNSDTFPVLTFRDASTDRLLFTNSTNQLRFRYDGTNDGIVVHTAASANFGSNSLTAQNFILSSDQRFKSNIEDIAPRDNVKWRQFTIDGNLRYGVIAQELEDIYPEFVYEDDDGYKSVSYTDILVAENARLNNRVEELEKDIEVIKNILKDGAVNW